MKIPIQNHKGLPMLKAHLANCLESLRASGYSRKTLKKRRATFTALVQWLEQREVSDIDAITEASINAFLERIPVWLREQRKLEAAGIAGGNRDFGSLSNAFRAGPKKLG